MNEYFFILGRVPLLSTWEIISHLNLSPNSFKFSQQFLVIPLGGNFNPTETLKQLGGTIKIGKIIGRVASSDIAKDDFLEQLVNQLSGQPRPLFGLSYYGNDKKLPSQIGRMGLSLKKQLKARGTSSRFVTSRQPVLSSVVVAKNKLIEKGAEFVFLSDGPKIYLGVTQVVQEFEQYSQRDYGRPSRDSYSGMLPPKLAKMMINLTGVPKNGLLLDPFCGSGTILQEALLMGYQEVVGSDISTKAIRDSEDNLKWLFKDHHLKSHYQLIESDSRTVFKKIKTPSAIITEPYLGPPRFNQSQLPKIINELDNLYRDFFEAASKYLVKGTPIVIIWPVWRINNNQYHLSILNEVKSMGFALDTFKIEEQKYDSAIYQRPGQRVFRQIMVWRKK